MAQPRPAGWSRWHAGAFQDADVASAYAFRAPYPREVFTTLAGLLDSVSGAVLDVGCGRGELARPMLEFAGRVDALDASAQMLECGRELPDGDSPRLRWIHGRLENATLYPPYGLATAGQSLHWMEWDVALPRLREVLTERGVLAIVDLESLSAPWDDEMLPIFGRYSTNKDYEPHDLIRELESRDLFEKHGARHISPTPFSQTVDEAIEAYHATSSLSRARMGEDDVHSFDEAVRAVFARHAPDGVIHRKISASIVWGRPLRGGSPGE